VNHFTASCARTWSPGVALPVFSAGEPEIVAIVVVCVARYAPPYRWMAISIWSKVCIYAAKVLTFARGAEYLWPVGGGCDNYASHRCGSDDYSGE